MTSRFLEISSGQNLPARKFEIVEVQKDNFMLKTKDSHVELLGTLDKSLQSNNTMGESGYSNML
jgi:WD40 repeat protein